MRNGFQKVVLEWLRKSAHHEKGRGPERWRMAVQAEMAVRAPSEQECSQRTFLSLGARTPAIHCEETRHTPSPKNDAGNGRQVFWTC